MKIEAVLRAAQILRTQPAYTMSLNQLHARLQSELGADAGTYGQFYLHLKNRPQSFTIIDAPQLLRGSDIWPAQVREEYDSVLENAGLGTCIRVALTEVAIEEAQPGAIALASKTIGELWGAAQQDSVLCEFLAHASRQIEEISSLLADAEATRPTTPPPDLQPEPRSPRSRKHPARRLPLPPESRPE